VVAVADIGSAVYNPDGLEVDNVAKWVDQNRYLEGYPDADQLAPAAVFGLPCDILVPAAVQNVLTVENAHEVKARIVIEGANNPTTLEADEILRKQGVFIVPDILANAGGVTASYFEWVQDVQKYFWTENEIVARLREIMTRAFDDVLSVAIARDVDLRTAALIRGISKVAEAKLVRGIFP
jgi:glutamate dehydrogenase (NAD(P)+)